MSPLEPALLTLGHSNRTLDEFLALLRAHAVSLVADVRTLPRSRHNPQFNLDTLPAELARAGIAYSHLPQLGGLRRPRLDSTNRGWRDDGFRGFADYMMTPDFDTALDQLLARAARERTAILCAEAMPWHCHRTLIADALVARDHPVHHLLDSRPPRPHALTPFGRAEGGRVTYPEIAPQLPGLEPPIDSARADHPASREPLGVSPSSRPSVVRQVPAAKIR